MDYFPHSYAVLVGEFISCEHKSSLLLLHKSKLPLQLLRYPQIVRIQISQVASLCLIHSQVPRPGSSQIRGMGQQPDPPVSGPPDIFFDDLSATVRSTVFY